MVGDANASTIGWVVDAGSDFPAEFRAQLEDWQTACMFREDSTRLTTRAWNSYGPDEHRSTLADQLDVAIRQIRPNIPCFHD